MKIRFSGSRVVPCGQTDRRNEANSRFSQLCERALKNPVSYMENNGCLFCDQPKTYKYSVWAERGCFVC